MPAQFLVRNPDGGFIDCVNAADAQSVAQKLAQKHIGAYVDVYQCVGCMRAAASPLILPGSASNE